MPLGALVLAVATFLIFKLDRYSPSYDSMFNMLFTDEPTAALDSQCAGLVIDLLKKVATEQQAAVIVVTHDHKIFERFDHIFSLRDGALESELDKAA